MIASSYHSGSESRTACSSTASRPMRWITIARRHLALAEARELQLATERGGGALEARLDLLARHLGVEAHAGVG